MPIIVFQSLYTELRITYYVLYSLFAASIHAFLRINFEKEAKPATRFRHYPSYTTG